MTQAVINTSTSSLLQQGFQSLEKKVGKMRYSAALKVKSENISRNISSCLVSLSFPYLSQLVGLFPLGHGGPGRKRLAGLSSDAGTHFVLCLLCVLRGDTCCWSD